MNAKEWAEKLNGREYREELSDEESDQAKKDCVVIAFGYSDDNLEFRGAINEEVSAWNGTTVKLTNKPSVFDPDENKETSEFNSMQISAMKKVNAIWCPRNENNKIWSSWLIEALEIPHETFDIMEYGELFCRGIVFESKHLTEMN